MGHASGQRDNCLASRNLSGRGQLRFLLSRRESNHYHSVEGHALVSLGFFVRRLFSFGPRIPRDARLVVGAGHGVGGLYLSKLLSNDR